MNYKTIPTKEELLESKTQTSIINEDIIATEIANVVKLARQRGESLEDLQTQILRDDRILDRLQRRWLKDLIAKAWELIPQTTINSEE